MTHATAWLLLVASGIVDVAWAFAVKRAEGFSNPGWAVASMLLLALFIGLLAKALELLPLGTAYAVWTGIGATGSVLVGAWLLGEPLGALRLSFIAAIAIGIIGLRLTSH